MAGEPTVEGSARSGAGVVELREVTKRYTRDGPAAVDGLSLTIPAGEVCVLIGPRAAARPPRSR